LLVREAVGFGRDAKALQWLQRHPDQLAGEAVDGALSLVSMSTRKKPLLCGKVKTPFVMF
jgi:hypothetical protein